MDSLLIQFRDNGTAHDDIHVCLEGFSRTADSYYFALDPEMLPGRESTDKVRQVLVQLLQHWLNTVAQAESTEAAYLPFDFSDQYTGCFQCKPHGEFLEVVPGWSSREGWSVSPSNPGDYFFGITDFKSDSAPVRLPKEEFLRRIREAIANAE